MNIAQVYSILDSISGGLEMTMLEQTALLF